MAIQTFKAYEGEVRDEIKRKGCVSRYVTEKARVKFMRRLPCFGVSWWEGQGLRCHKKSNKRLEMCIFFTLIYL